MPQPKKYSRALTIAGSDSGGGAGIQADLKTFSALGCYGMSVITALTAQNTRAVTAIQDLPADFIRAQINAVCSDIGTDAVKIGMLATAEVIEVVTQGLIDWKLEKVVLDPVMVAKSGDKLLRDEAIHYLKKLLIPRATIVTPNLPEAEVLTGTVIQSPSEMENAGRKILESGPRAVLIKGGHATGSESNDCLVYLDESEVTRIQWLPARRIPTQNTHGTGCTLSSAITAWLARGATIQEAVKKGHEFLHGAILAGSEYKLGEGHGPVYHFYAVRYPD